MNNLTEQTKNSQPSNDAKKQGVRSGDWVCNLCQNHNYSFREICNRCHVQFRDQNDYEGFKEIKKPSINLSILKSKIDEIKKQIFKPIIQKQNICTSDSDSCSLESQTENSFEKIELDPTDQKTVVEE